ncbi:uncharacterized protein LOC128743440 [Sabethes cyaneus]|uniref:uncharacterized protein LOC128743440 n=1 Tax=Sabethes cyaneus TaxID=53552 RepID=UPI00237E10E7|nr:uncharacterized protein LOC128743440 [Sabethes cyaneus]
MMTFVFNNWINRRQLTAVCFTDENQIQISVVLIRKITNLIYAGCQECVNNRGLRFRTMFRLKSPTTTSESSFVTDLLVSITKELLHILLLENESERQSALRRPTASNYSFGFYRSETHQNRTGTAYCWEYFHRGICWVRDNTSFLLLGVMRETI